MSGFMGIGVWEAVALAGMGLFVLGAVAALIAIGIAIGRRSARRRD